MTNTSATSAPAGRYAGGRKRLGEMLIEAGFITEAVLKEQLAEQKARKMRLGQCLIFNRIVTEEDIIAVVSKQLRIETLRQSKFAAEPSLASVVSEKLAHKCSAIPVHREGSLLWVGMTDPTDFNSINDLMQATNHDIEPVMCTEQEFEELFFATYGSKYSAQSDMLLDVEDIAVEQERRSDAETATFSVDSLQNMAEEAPVVRLVNSILVQALNRRASDIHIQPEQDSIGIRFRVDGKLENVPSPPKSVLLPLVSRIKLLSNIDISVSRMPQDGRFTYRAQNREVSVRTATAPSIYGEKVVMRLLDQGAHSLTLEDMDIVSSDRRKIDAALRRPHGMLLATGPTGSGKSTMLYALLKKMNKPEHSIVTLEDPVEYRIKGICQMQLNTRAGMTFASGLRSILRQDPDTIMVGEIRDQETADIAIKAALTGHKVLSTLHTNDAPGAVTRFVEMGIEPFLVASTVVLVMAQRLVRRICPDCAAAYTPTREELAQLGVRYDSGIQFFRGAGCFACNRTGYRGRLAVFEMLPMENTVRDLVLQRASSQEIRDKAVAGGLLRTLTRDAAERVLAGQTTFEEFLGVSFDT
ncbi:GspE/PulE family protein [Megalodesulfovibrio gigas]|uniref:Putative type II/IV secretion system family protein n=1 Tax=Megalodesulfovibrio gigas (strain ATCC 19364 / DSM 1382 / NCIMB 9332 / VKM B-1759) TaxID=1121448 RepID=T2G8Q4_MEGG1|nr:GspE/PulE family protein [Megalodesulfovibrio gigas]AGW12516.1 putative type II/IV secretion system family protein [Megalodesulfovibrio gigas DSM 1382 = ATCC 19364]